MCRDSLTIFLVQTLTDAAVHSKWFIMARKWHFRLQYMILHAYVSIVFRCKSQTPYLCLVYCKQIYLASFTFLSLFFFTFLVFSIKLIFSCCFPVFHIFIYFPYLSYIFHIFFLFFLISFLSLLIFLFSYFPIFLFPWFLFSGFLSFKSKYTT